MKLLKSSVILGRIRQSFLLFISLSLLPLGQLQSQNFETASITVTDNVLAGETIVKILNFKGSLYFATKNADGRQVKLWRVNGDLGGIVKVFDIAISGGSNFDFVYEHWLFRQNDQHIFFLHDGGTNGLQLWRFDGVNAQEVTNLDGGAGNSFITTFRSWAVTPSVELTSPILHGFGYEDDFYFQADQKAYSLKGDGQPEMILSEVTRPRHSSNYGPKLRFVLGGLRLVGDDLLVVSGTSSSRPPYRFIRLEDGGVFTPPTLTSGKLPFDLLRNGTFSPYTYAYGILRLGDDIIYSASRWDPSSDNGIYQFSIPTGNSAAAATHIPYMVDANLAPNSTRELIIARNLRLVPELNLLFFNYRSGVEFSEETAIGTEELFALNLGEDTPSPFVFSDYHTSRSTSERSTRRPVDLYNAIHHSGKVYLILEKGNVASGTGSPNIPFELYRADGSAPDPPITAGQMGSLVKVHNGRLFRERDAAYMPPKTVSGYTSGKNTNSLFPDLDDPYMISFKGHLYYRVKDGNLYRVSNSEATGTEVAGAGTRVRYLKIVEDTLYWLAVPPGASGTSLQLLSTDGDGSTVSVLSDIPEGLRALPLTVFNGLVFAVGSSPTLVGGLASKSALEEGVAISSGSTVSSFRYTPGTAMKRYWVVLPAASQAPSVQQVVGGRDGDGTDAPLRSMENFLPLPEGIAKGEAVLGLTPSTPYKLYLVLENLVGGGRILLTEDFTTTGEGMSNPFIDFSPPALLGRGLHVITFPDAALIDFTPDEPISYRWVLQQKDLPDPSVEQVIAGNNGDGAAALQSSNGLVHSPYLTPQTVRIKGLTASTEYGFFLWAQDHNSPPNGMKKIQGKIFQTQEAGEGATELTRLIDITDMRIDNIETTKARIYFTPAKNIEVFFVALPKSSAYPPGRSQILAGQDRSGTVVPDGRAAPTSARDRMFDREREDYIEITGLDAGTDYTAFVVAEEEFGFLETRELHFSTPASAGTLASLEGPIDIDIDSSGNATVAFTPTEAGSYFYVVTRASESPLSTSQVKVGQSGSGAPALRTNSDENPAARALAADTEKEVVLSGLPLEASYRFHLVFEDSGRSISSGMLSSEVFRMYLGDPILRADIEPTVDFGKHSSERRNRNAPKILLRVGGQNATSDITFTKTNDDDGRFEVEVVEGSSLVAAGASGKVLAIAMFQESSGDASPVTANLNLTYGTQTLDITLTGQSVPEKEKTVSGVPSRLDFGAIPAGESSSRSIRVFGNNLDTDNVSISFDPTPSLFSAGGGTISGEDTNAILGREVIVTFSPTTTSPTGMEIAETLTLSYMDGTDDDATVALSGRVSASDGTSGTGTPDPVPTDTSGFGGGTGNVDPPVTNPTFGGSTIDNQTYTANMAITPLILPTASGGTGILTYALAPALPNGLNFDADNRRLSGTPMEAASATSYTYMVTDSTTDTALTASLTFTITVNAEGSPTFADTVANQNYAKDTAIMNLMLPSATGGTPPLMYSLTPALPAGLEFDVDSLTLSGTPTVAAATTSYTYTVTDGTGGTALTASLTFTITVNEALRFLTTVDAKTYTKDTAITPLILPEASGGTVPLSYTLTPALPNGLSFDADTRRLSGTPGEAAPATPYTYTVTDRTTGTAVTASLTFTITVREALRFLTPIDNQAYTANVVITPLTLPEASGGMGSPTYTLTPALPNGLSFDADTRRLTGTPMEAASATLYTYTVTDSNALTASLTFTITVNVEGSPTFTETVANQNYAKDTAIMNLMLPSATGGTSPLMYSLTPALPAGLEFDVDSRTLSGTPTVAAATASYTYTVTDSTADTGLTASLTFTITVSDALRFIMTIDAKTYTKDTAITPLILPEALGGTIPLSYALTPALPNGLSFDANTRRLTGTPTVEAATAYTYTVTDSTIGTAVTASLTFMITVSEALGFITTIGNQAYTVNMAITPLTLPEASGGVGRLTYTLTPALPNGLSFDANTRRLTGTPMEAAFARPYTYTATDRATGRVLMTFTITVSDAEIFGIGNPGATVHVYPNPAGDVLHIEFPGADEYGIALLTLTGKPVLGERHAGGGTRVLDLSSLTRGVYFLKIEDGVGISHTLLIIR